VAGKEIVCTDFELVDDEISEIEHKKTVGGEKNKMVLQPIGKTVIEFLLKQYESVFEYDYTKRMEKQLDKISNGKKIWHSLCQECYDDINQITEKIKEESKVEYKIDNEHTYTLARYGPVIMKRVPDPENSKKTKVSYLKVKSDLTLEQIKEGNLTIEEMTVPKREKTDNNLGKHKGKDVILKSGKYGLYVNYDGKNTSLKGLDKPENEVELADVISYLENKQTNTGVVRELNKNTSVRKGKYGLYIFYKTQHMKRPKFINIQKFKGGDVETCDKDELLEWVQLQLRL
jgi:DNA topoisomerase-1